jgi:hypothetical protein
LIYILLQNQLILPWLAELTVLAATAWRTTLAARMRNGELAYICGVNRSGTPIKVFDIS